MKRKDVLIDTCLPAGVEISLNMALHGNAPALLHRKIVFIMLLFNNLKAPTTGFL